MAVELVDVKAVATLARLEFSSAEEVRLSTELRQILKYMEKLNELDTEQVEPTAHVAPPSRSPRADEAELFAGRDLLLKLAPQPADEYFKVPRIIE
jgi:aspartyl-tRNA(Asn)/glutamyl-tRNA(Gln) amidotransferase subunit C